MHQHGTDVKYSLVRPWIGSNRYVCGDSFFATVETAEALLQNGLRFTGVVKTSTIRFPMKYLSSIEITGRSDSTFLVTDVQDGTKSGFNILGCAWVDRARRCFV